MSVIEVLVLTGIGCLVENIVGNILAGLYLECTKHKKKK